MTFQPKGMLGIKTSDRHVVPVLDFEIQNRNQTVFTTIADQQKKAVFDFYYRDRENPQWVYLDSLPLQQIPPAAAGEPDLRVRASVDERGNLSVRLLEVGSKREHSFYLDAEVLADRFGRPSTERSGVDSTTDGESRRADGRRKKAVGWKFILAVFTLIILGALILWLRPAALFAGGSKRSGPQGDLHEGSEIQGTGQRSDSEAAAPDDATAAPSLRETERTAEEEAIPAVKRTDEIPVTGRTDEAFEIGKAAAERHRITWGDTLWRITEHYYGDRDLFLELADINSLADPDYIIAGENLFLPPDLEGRERVVQPQKESAR